MSRSHFLLVCVLAMYGCAEKRETGGPVSRYFLEGTVVRIHAERQVATIQHGPIRDKAGKVWMEPMTMDFPVPEREEFAKLRVGQKVRATVHQRESDYEYWIADIQVEAEPKMGETSHVLGHPPQGGSIVD